MFAYAIGRRDRGVRVHGHAPSKGTRSPQVPAVTLTPGMFVLLVLLLWVPPLDVCRLFESPPLATLFELTRVNRLLSSGSGAARMLRNGRVTEELGCCVRVCCFEGSHLWLSSPHNSDTNVSDRSTDIVPEALAPLPKLHLITGAERKILREG